MAIWSPNIETIESGNVAVSNFPASQPVTGPLTDSELRATAVPVSGPLTDAQLRATPVPVSGTVTTTGGSVASATVTSVVVSPTVATLAASNASRLKLIIHNENGVLFVKLGTAASSTSYSYRLTQNTVLELTQYTGEVTAIKNTGTSDCLVTEL